MSYLNVHAAWLGTPTPQPTATVLSLYKYAPPTPSANTPSPQPPPQLSALGSTNGGKLAGPVKAPYGPAILPPVAKVTKFG